MCWTSVQLQEARPWLYFRPSLLVRGLITSVFSLLNPCRILLAFPVCESSVVVYSSIFCIFTKGFLCVNDASVSRTLRLRKVLHSYVPKQFLTEEALRITSFDGTKWGEIEGNTFDRVSQRYIIMFILCRNRIYRLPVSESVKYLSKSPNCIYLLLYYVCSGPC